MATMARDMSIKRTAPDSPPACPPPRKKEKRKLKRWRSEPIDPVGAKGTLLQDMRELLQKSGVDPENAKNDIVSFMNRDRSVPWRAHKEVELDVLSFSGIGVGLAIHEGMPVAIPFTIPGDKIKARISRTEEFWYEAQMLEVLQPSPDRRDDLINCRYFGTCSGCQYQFLSYEKQLDLKRDVIVRAYNNLAPSLVASGRLPQIHDTIPSPLQYGYRTKLTPHFDVPRRGRLTSPPAIGFGIKGGNGVLDIEECAIGTPVLNKKLTEVRAKVMEQYATYKKGATLLLRESRTDSGELEVVTDNREIVREKVGEWVFEFRAGEFFQNNNSILPIIAKFVRDNLMIAGEHPKYVVDTYCGSGLFSITCSASAVKVIGVEISAESVAFARTNAAKNGIENAEFIVGEAERIFEHVSSDPLSTAVVIDPSRKGCDHAFLDQLAAFGPAKIIYVSCNVHSQARDLEYFLAKAKYKVESLGGFDFFPQTHHVEGVAVLSNEQ